MCYLDLLQSTVLKSIVCIVGTKVPRKSYLDLLLLQAQFRKKIVQCWLGGPARKKEGAQNVLTLYYLTNECTDIVLSYLINLINLKLALSYCI